jgi:class 3 adenylate cyclase
MVSMLSRLRSLVLRLAGSQVPRPADGVVVLAVLAIAVITAYGASQYSGMTQSDAIPVLNSDMLRWSFGIRTQVILPTWIAVLVAALLARRRWPDSRILAHGAIQLLFIELAFHSYEVGHYTDLIGLGGLFGGIVLGWWLFEIPLVRAGVVTFIAVVFATTVAEQRGMIPYAPLLDRSPFEAGHLAGEWLFPGPALLSFSLLAAVAFLFLAGMQRLRVAQQQLERSNRLIRRYVPAQLAEKILAGEHTGTGHPERRKVTLFFSDVVGFTDSADRMEAEDLSALLNEYLSEMTSIADSFGATINQFVGDGIMIFFGAPEATTDSDHALRAVRMALAMQRRMGELGEKWFREGIQTPFCVRIGINTGVASVGDFGSEGRTTYSAIGNQTNLTARIQDHCEPGKVLISHTTWALVEDKIPCEEQGEIEVKGLHYPVRVYKVMEEAPPDAGAA